MKSTIWFVLSYQWVETRVGSRLPNNAVRGGMDADGSQIYVGKRYHNGDWIPAKVIPIRSVAYLAYNRKEHANEIVQASISSGMEESLLILKLLPPLPCIP
ncbi:hypothetical protein JTB14_037272 [Gonioctena quinquepunctata]|nr:hypothetical protein JTB14_037272 [Gonioctena quinquepunctata]